MDTADFKNMKRELKSLDENPFKFLCKNGIVPYDYEDSVEKLEPW